MHGCGKPHPPAFHSSMAPIPAIVAGGLQRGQLRRALAAEVPSAATQHAARLRHVIIFIVIRAAALRPAQPSSKSYGLVIVRVIRLDPAPMMLGNFTQEEEVRGPGSHQECLPGLLISRRL